MQDLSSESPMNGFGRSYIYIYIKSPIYSMGGVKIKIELKSITMWINDLHGSINKVVG